MSSKVFFAPIAQGESESSISAKVQKVFRKAGLGQVVPQAGLTAVKTHFGEEGNDSYIPAPHVKVVIDEVRAAGGKPCLVETSTLYRGRRSNAADHFTLAVEHGFDPANQLAWAWDWAAGNASRAGSAYRRRRWPLRLGRWRRLPYNR